MARKTRSQIWLEYIAARTVFGTLGLMPRRMALATSIGIARAAYRLLGGLRRVGMRNLEIAFPEKSVEEREQVLKGTFESLGRVLGETSQFHKMTPADLEHIVDFTFDDETREYFHYNKESKRGFVITTGHFGNWELLVFAFGALYEPINYLARPIDNPLIEELTLRHRTRFGNRPINKTNSARMAIKVLREGGLLGVLADVNTHPKEGVFVPFFGVPACTTAGPALIALRADALIYPVFCVWDKEIGRYRFIHGRLIEPVRTGDRDHDVLETTAAYTAEIERLYRQYPDQWMWIHKRWKTRPKGEPPLY